MGERVAQVITRIQTKDDDGRYCLCCSSDACYDRNACGWSRLAEKLNDVIDRLNTADEELAGLEKQVVDGAGTEYDMRDRKI